MNVIWNYVQSSPTSSLAGSDGRCSDLAESRVTLTLVGAFDVDAGVWTAVVDPASTLVHVCGFIQMHSRIRSNWTDQVHFRYR